mgnify:FL=1
MDNKHIIEIKNAVEKEDLDNVFEIRKLVFVEEKGISLEDELDEYDKSSEHIIVYYNNQPAATGRLRIIGDTAKLERICVKPEFRMLGLGKVVVGALETTARKKGIKKLKLHAMQEVKEFYAKLGYAQHSGEFMEAGIPHVLMTKSID